MKNNNSNINSTVKAISETTKTLRETKKTLRVTKSSCPKITDYFTF